jgi:hypothetical protein
MDETEQVTEAQAAEMRRGLVTTMPAELAARVEAGERVWTTEEMTAEFEALGFQAPFCIVRRRADQQLGSLLFTHRPRFYFGWEPDGGADQ